MNSKGTTIKRLGLLVFMTLAFCGLLVLFFSVTNRLSDLKEAPGDNASWTLSQVEVDVLLLDKEVSATQVNTPEISRRFNNLYSRINLIRDSYVFAAMIKDKTFNEHLTELENSLDFMLPIIDGPDDALRASTNILQQKMLKTRITSRNLAVSGIRLRATQSDNERNSFSNLLVVAASVSLILIISLVLATFFFIRQYHNSRKISEQVKRTSTRLKSSFDTSLDAIIVANSMGVILDFNGAAEKIFGFTKEETRGVFLSDLIIPDQYKEAHIIGLERFRKTKEVVLTGAGRVEITALRKDGKEIPIEIAIGQAEEGNETIFISYIRDITERLNAEENLKIARDEALEAEKTQSNFLAVMSHEMRTPLNGLFGTLGLLNKTKLNKKQTEYLDMAKSSGDILLHHVNDVLDISRLDSGKMELISKPVDLDTFFSNSIITNQETAKNQNNKLVLRLSDMPEKNAYLDEHRLRQIIYNLLSNAMKFTQNGTITVSAFTYSDAFGQNYLEFSVTDTGVGIAQKNIEQIFDEFYIQDKSYDRVASGAGLGLSITKRIIDMMDGEINVISVQGKGSTFIVNIPISYSDEDTDLVHEVEDKQDFSLLNGLEIMLVEDNEINRVIIKDVLKNHNVHVTEAHNGLEAVTAASKKAFDAILMDVSMPVMNGEDATAKIRSSNHVSSKTPIIGLTAHALDKEQKRFLSAGMDVCLIKPIEHNELLKTIIALVSGQDFKSNKHVGNSQSYMDIDVFNQVKQSLASDKFNVTLTKYEQEINKLMLDLPQLIEIKDQKNTSDQVHKSIGSSGILGAAKMQSLLRELEMSAKSKDWKSAKIILRRVKPIWEKTIHDIDQLRKS